MNEKEVKDLFLKFYSKYKDKINGNFIFRFNKSVTMAGVCKFPRNKYDVGLIEI